MSTVLAALAVGIPALALVLSSTAAAATGVPEPSHPGDDFAGSQILRHEDTSRSGVKLTTPRGTEGVDVSSYQGSVAWSPLRNSGVRFAYVKATESTSYKNPSFTQQYNGSYKAGIIRGAYHFATPNTSSGATQARYFLAHGGGWSKDGKTLPGALDLEYNPYGSSCYGLSHQGMVSWVRDFSRTYKAKTGRDVVLYTSTNWWKSCTGNNSGFGRTNPLWVPHYGSSVGALPAGWKYQTIWQYTSKGAAVGDHDRFNGRFDRVKALANG
ncbi:lysozyme [Streptomyces sp. NPDC090052]|nr:MULTISPECIES: lysozyme [unclassified Streptomyces]MCX4727945.1 lysozyme [Streptomyces sp. NBC_01306]WSV02864.1 lysozyme [Streptomyces sp. NBC_01020]WSX40892.1 lysozyme [Streptomyces sp. NBC_00963]WSX71132.1 lysozyme [Streptomyces sp. NBC_00932]